jgi:cytochrome c
MRAVIVVAVLATIGAGEARAQDAAAGEKVFGACKACHQIGENAKSAAGAALNGAIGRKAGSVAGYSYSAGRLMWETARSSCGLSEGCPSGLNRGS